MHFHDRVEISYVKASQSDHKEKLPLLKIDDNVVREGETPDLRTIMDYIQKMGLAA